MSPVSVLFVRDGDLSGGASAAAVGADPMIELVGRDETPGDAAETLRRGAPDVVVVFASRDDHPGRAYLREAAARCGADVLVTGADETFESLRGRIKASGRNGGRGVRRGARGGARGGARATPAAAGRCTAKLIAIGASTGGVEALVEVLSGFPAGCPPTVIVQHMPPFFTTSFAARLDTLCAPAVHEAWDGAPLRQGELYLAPGGSAHLEVDWRARTVRLIETPPVNRHRPAVDVTFRSVAAQLGKQALGVLLTGMGRDGAEGLKEMRAAGARTIAQDKASSTVYGMPRAALELGAVDFGTPLKDIAAAIFSPETAPKETLAWP